MRFLLCRWRGFGLGIREGRRGQKRVGRLRSELMPEKKLESEAG